MSLQMARDRIYEFRVVIEDQKPSPQAHPASAVPRPSPHCKNARQRIDGGSVNGGALDGPAARKWPGSGPAALAGPLL